MQFNSISFLFYFLPAFLAVYYIVPGKARSAVLLLGSMVFYAAGAGEPWWLVLLAALTLMTYFMGRVIGSRGDPWMLGITLAVMAAVLVFFKCWDGGKRLPGGMSFYLFQMSAYLIDVYRRRLEPERNALSFGAQIMLFPKLLSGPIVEPTRLKAQIAQPCRCGLPFHRGLQELILGLGMKVLLADRLCGLWAQAGVAGYGSISTPFAWMALVAYALRLYFDFYGYSLMAVGLGHMLGFHLPMNFLEPYSAKSVSEFFRRWHVTLGRWFREYIYIPLGGNRKGMGRTVLHLAVVWLLTGFWHGTGGNYLVWAGIAFLLIVNEKLWLGKWLERSRVLCHIYTMAAVLLSWLPFAIGDWGQMVAYAGRLFGIGLAANSQDWLILGRMYWQLLCLGIFFATPLPKKLWHKVQNSLWTDAVLFILFWVIVYTICTSAQNPFMYFQY